jgi:hypothetical protein
MADATVRLQLPNGDVKKVEMPNDVPIGELMPELIMALQVPITGPDGRYMSYRLDSMALGRPLKESETLSGAAVPAEDRLTLSPIVTAGGGGSPKRRVAVIASSVGLPLDELKAVEVEKLLSNEPALMMALHSYRAALLQTAKDREELDRFHNRDEYPARCDQRQEHRHGTLDTRSDSDGVRYESDH